MPAQASRERAPLRSLSPVFGRPERGESVGGHPYQYVVDYDPDIQGALDRLRADVFARREFHGADRNPATPQAAVKLTGETGTRSILDITKVKARPDYCCVAPLTREEAIRYFGTGTPTVRQVDQSDEFWGELERGQARCVEVDDGGVRKWFFAGYSFD